ncbi:MAG: VCBS repeat-containing protein [Acidobacteriota bacterium]
MIRKTAPSALAVAIALLFSVPLLGLAQPGAPQLVPGSAEHVELKRQAAESALNAPSDVLCDLVTPDFVVTGSSSTASSNEHCFPSDGVGTFAPRTDIVGLGIVDGLDVADLDNDGDNDFLACDGLTGEVYLYTQDPATVFTPTPVVSGVTGPGGAGGASLLCTYLRIADFDGNGLGDFVVGDNRTTNGVFVYLQNPVGVFTQVAPGLDISWASSNDECNCLFALAAGDVNADGHEDIMLLGFLGDGAGQIWYYQGNGTGAMAPPTLKVDVSADFPVVVNPTGMALFDSDGDGDLDIVVGGSFDGSHYIYTNDGMNNYIAPAAVAFNTNNYSGIDSFDVNGDQREDLMVVDWTSQRLLYIQNLGNSLASPAAVGVVDAPSLGVGAPERPERQGFDLDHFKCYLAAADKPVDETVGLTDQFDSVDAEVFETRRFCNAVAKWHDGVLTPIQNEDAHLEMLTIVAEGKTPSLVEVTNQFGESQQLDIGDAAFLAVPTQKIEPGDHPFPKNLDHFQCYEAFGKSVSVPVDLRDQFGFEPELVALQPQLLCNPTKKEHNGVTTPVDNPFDHLVCYELDNTQQLVKSAFIKNQFGARNLALDQAELLCLPSEKKVILE